MNEYRLYLCEQLEINLLNIMDEITNEEKSISYLYTTILIKIVKLKFVKKYNLSRDEKNNYILENLEFEYPENFEDMSSDNDLLIEILDDLEEIKSFNARHFF